MTTLRHRGLNPPGGLWRHAAGASLAIAGLAAVSLMPAGCAESGFGESLLEPRQRVRSAAEPDVPAGGIHVPAGTPMAVADATRFSTGDAASQSTADRAGTAHASASLTGIGDGWAEFTLGHVLPAGRSSAQNVLARVSVEYTYEMQAPEGSTAAAGLTGEVALKVVVMDSQRRIIRKQLLTQASDDDGSARWSGRQQVEFDLSLAPDRAYHFIIAGRTQMTREVPSRSAESDAMPAEAALSVSAATIDIVPSDP